MSLPKELLSQFVKVTRDVPKSTANDVVYGRYTIYEGAPHVMLEGSDAPTPISTTVNAKEGEIIAIQIKDHTAVAMGNASSPAARTGDVEDLEGRIIEANYVKTDVLKANYATIDNLNATNANVENLQAENVNINNLVAQKASISDLEATNANIEKLVTKDAEIDELVAQKASISDLEAANANIENLQTKDAEIESLVSQKADIESLKTQYANIDFANIGEAAIKKIFADSGLIKDLVVRDQHLTGSFVGVTVKGDMIEGNTIKADKLVVLGDDGVYYKLNYDGGALSGEKVAETVYYEATYHEVTYDDETGEYVASESTMEPINGELVVGLTTKNGQDVYVCLQSYESESEYTDLYFCIVSKKIEDIYYGVTHNEETGEYITSESTISPLNGDLVENAITTDGRQVYTGINESNETIFFCKDKSIPIGDQVEGIATVNDKVLYSQMNEGVTTYFYSDVVYPDWAKNSLHGSVIVAKSVTADQIYVTDLNAFGATIGGFRITDSSLYSGVKESAYNTTPGVYMDSNGRFAVGDADNFIRFNADDDRKLEISASSIVFGVDSKTSVDDLKRLSEHVKISTWTEYTLKKNNIGNYVDVDPMSLDSIKVIDHKVDFGSGLRGVYVGNRADGSKLYYTEDQAGYICYELEPAILPSIELAEGDTLFKQVITNKKTMFMDADIPNTVIDTDGVSTDNLSVDSEIRHNDNISQAGSYVWAFRANGNYGLSWKGATS